MNFSDMFPQRRLQELRAQLDQRGALVNQLEGQLAELRRNMTDLSTRHRETLELVDDLENDLEEARDRHETLEAETRNERALHGAERSARERVEAELHARIDQLLGVVKATQDDLEAARARHEALAADTRSERALLERESAALRSKDEELGAERKTRERAEAELHARIDQLLGVVKATQDALAARDSELANERSSRSAAEGELSVKIDQLLTVVKSAGDALAAKDADLQVERSARSSAEAELRAMIEAQAEAGEHANDVVRKMLSDIEQLKISLQQAQTEVIGERRTRKDREADVRTLRERLAGREEERKELERRMDDLGRQHGELSEALRTVSLQLTAAAEETAARERDLARASEERAHATQRASELEASLKLEEGAGRAAKDTIAQIEAALQQERTAREELEQRLREKIENLIDRRDQIKTMVHTTSTELERARASLRIAENELSKERELRRKEGENATAKVRSAEESRQETKRLLREAHEVLRTEREASRALRTALDQEMSKKAQLALELAHSPMRQKLAAMEETLHTYLGRALDVAEPLADDDKRDGGVVEQVIQRAIEAAGRSGGVLVTRGRKNAKTGALTPDKFAAYCETNERAWAVAFDAGAPLKHAIEAAAPGRGSMTLSEAILRVSADFPLDPAVALLPVSEESLPKRLIVVACEDRAMGAFAASTLAKLAAGRALPPLPSPLVVRSAGLNLDAWLGAALAAAGNPKLAVLHVNGDALGLVANAADEQAAQLKALLLRARVLTLAWSDKCLGVASQQTFGAGPESSAFDQGDARMSVPLYRKLLRADQRLEALATTAGLFKQSDMVKLFVELTDSFALMQFCRDASIAVKPARAGDTPELFSPADDSRAVEFAKLIRAEVEGAASRERSNALGGLQALARAQERAGRYADALETFVEAVSETPADTASRVIAANYLELSGRDAAAERMLRDGLRNRTSVATTADALRDFYRRTENSQKTLAAARLMRRSGSANGALAVAAAAAALGKIGQARRAIDAFQETPRVKPAAFTRISRMIELQETLHDLRAAAETGGAEAWFALGDTLRQIDDVAGASAAYARAETAEKGFLERACGPGIGPDLLLIGPPRTATTLLRKALDLHPGVALLDGESSFLTRATPLAALVDDLRQARVRKGGSLAGDKSPMHFIIDPARVALAAQLFPHARIVITTREPVERAWSEIKLHGHRRVIDANIAAALGNGVLPRWLAETIESSRYLKHVRTWAEHFGADRVLLLQSEDFERNVHANCARLFDWLSLEHPDEGSIDRLQQNWSNRTANYPRDPALTELLEKECGGEIYTVRELEAALAENRSRNRTA